MQLVIENQKVKFIENDVVIASAEYLIDLEENLFIFNSLFVEESHRNQGLATRLVKIRIDIADREYPTFEKVVHCNSQSIGIYKKLGFRVKEFYTILVK